jgi:hypothetical protein
MCKACDSSAGKRTAAPSLCGHRKSHVERVTSF